MPADADPKLWQRALALHKKSIVIDGHNDITGAMVDMDFNLGDDSVGRMQSGGDPMHTDISRWKKGGMTGEFMSIYVSGSTMQTGGAMRRAMDLIDATYREAERHPQDLSMCTTAEQIRLQAQLGQEAVLLLGRLAVDRRERRERLLERNAVASREQLDLVVERVAAGVRAPALRRDDERVSATLVIAGAPLRPRDHVR